ncbi:homoserine dehydrogenase, partial [Candidatus Woesearchaeota archaeon]|nr:homoserine dehydrogenase [Candidatus Woesearchaeota archaeon]
GNWGYAIKLVAIAKKADGDGEGIDVRVHPMLIPKKHPLASVEGELNAVYLNGDLVDGQMFYGKGAGQLPTASAVISDVIDVMKSVAVVRNFNNMPLIDINDLEFSYYLRLPVIDRPGVLYRIAKVLATSGVSIAELLQPSGKESVPLIIKTHRAKERMIRHAFNEINKLAVVKKGAVMIRILD